MSNFQCPHCGAAIIDSPGGYISGCKHYPLGHKQPERKALLRLVEQLIEYGKLFPQIPVNPLKRNEK